MLLLTHHCKIDEQECLHSVVDPSKNGVNKHRYVCAINDDEVRSSLRNGIQVVPLLYIRRSVLIMEPASSTTVKARSRDEKAKFTAELKSPGGKRKRQPEDTEDDNDGIKEVANQGKPEQKKTKKTYGRKEPNPLSVKKKKKEHKPQGAEITSKRPDGTAEGQETKPDNGEQTEAAGEGSGRKRRRKHKSKTTSGDSKDNDNPVEAPAGEE